MTPFELVTTIVSAAGGSAVIVAGLAAWLGKLWADRIATTQKLLNDVDVDLRKRRIEVYPVLWELTAVLPKWPRDSTVTYERLRQFSEELREWYFKKGGMYLSRTTHIEGYVPLQDTLERVLSSGSAGTLSPTDYETVRDRCSCLRTCLAGDIESRRGGIDPRN